MPGEPLVLGQMLWAAAHGLVQIGEEGAGGEEHRRRCDRHGHRQGGQRHQHVAAQAELVFAQAEILVLRATVEAEADQRLAAAAHGQAAVVVARHHEDVPGHDVEGDVAVPRVFHHAAPEGDLLIDAQPEHHFLLGEHGRGPVLHARFPAVGEQGLDALWSQRAAAGLVDDYTVTVAGAVATIADRNVPGCMFTYTAAAAANTMPTVTAPALGNC